MTEEMKQELLQQVKLTGMCGLHNLYISAADMLKETLQIISTLPIYDTTEEYYSFLDKKAQENNFYEKIARKYDIKEDEVKLKYLSANNVYALILYFLYEKADNAKESK